MENLITCALLKFTASQKARLFMIKCNYHTHTTFSDGKNTPEEMIQKAISLGFHSIGISDHAYTDFCPDWSIPKERLEEYLQTLFQLKEKYAGVINVLVGLEQDAFAPLPPKELDYCIGSVHWLKKDGEYIPLDESYETLKDALSQHYHGDANAMAEDYFALVSRYAEAPEISIIGHFDLITKFDEKYFPLFLPTPRYTAAWKNAAQTLINSGKIFEINTGALARNHRKTPYPSEEILQFLAKNGAKIMINSDCHAAEALDFAFDEAECFAKKYGFDPVISM